MIQFGPEVCGSYPQGRDEWDERSSAAQGEIAAHRVDVRRSLVAVSGCPEPIERVSRHRLPPQTACLRRGESAGGFLGWSPRSPLQIDRASASVDQRVVHHYSADSFEPGAEGTAKPLWSRRQCESDQPDTGKVRGEQSMGWPGSGTS